jgi:hypothetical protein
LVSGDVAVGDITGGVYLSEGELADAGFIAQAGAFGEDADIGVVELAEYIESERWGAKEED